MPTSPLLSLLSASLWAATLTHSGAALAQDQRTLAPVEVIGTMPLPGIGQPLYEIAAPVQSATSRELRQSGALDLGDFMNRALGSVHVNDIQGNPYQLDVNYRGYTASPLLGTPQGLSVYMDGVRMNQPFGDVVSWDLIPKGAIATLTLIPGSNPLFGLNTLGGALSVQTKDGRSHPGASLELGLGSHQRRSVEFETGGFNSNGLSWYANAHLFAERGWRDQSPSNVRQLFGKLGWQGDDTDVKLTLAHADNQLSGNGLQELSMLARDYASVYTLPDETRSTSSFLNLAASHSVNQKLLLSGNLYVRRIQTQTLNGDINQDALTGSIYQPDANDQAALGAAGFAGFPGAGADVTNTPFPFWKCQAQVLLNDEPALACTGTVNRSHSTQTNYGLSGQATWLGELAGQRHQLVLGAAYDASQVRFSQTSELGFLNADRSVTGTGAFADGASGGTLNGAPLDNRVDLAGDIRTWSLFASDTWSISQDLHLSLAGRFNRTEVRNVDQIRAANDPATLSGNHDFERFNPALGLTWSPGKNLNTYLGLSESSRAPTAIELGCANPRQPCRLPNSMAGDPPLNQVVTRTVEAGLRGSFGDAWGNPWKWNAGVFRAENSDDILFVADNRAGFGYFKNFGQTRRQGLELGASGKIGAVTLGAHYTWLEATYQSPQTVNGSGNSSNDQALAGNPGVDSVINIQPGDHIPLIPQHLLKLSAHYAASSRFALNANLVAISGALARGNENAQHSPDGNLYQGPGEIAGYAVLNLGADWRPTAKLQLGLQINNLMDLRYNTAAQLGANGFNGAGAVNADPFGNGSLPQSTFFAPGAPRSFSVSLKYVFD